MPTSDHLPTNENKLLFSIAVCSKQTAVCCRQTEVCCFCFLFAANKQKLSFVCCIYTHIYAAVSNGKWKMENRSPGDILNLFTVSNHANVSLLFVYLLTKKQTGLNGFAHLCLEAITRNVLYGSRGTMMKMHQKLFLT